MASSVNAITPEIEAREWEALYLFGVDRIRELRTSVSSLEATCDTLVLALNRALDRSNFMRAALQHYASHAWNDIEREMLIRWPE